MWVAAAAWHGLCSSAALSFQSEAEVFSDFGQNALKMDGKHWSKCHIWCESRQSRQGRGETCKKKAVRSGIIFVGQTEEYKSTDQTLKTTKTKHQCFPRQLFACVWVYRYIARDLRTPKNLNYSTVRAWFQRCCFKSTVLLIPKFCDYKEKDTFSSHNQATLCYKSLQATLPLLYDTLLVCFNWSVPSIPGKI